MITSHLLKADLMNFPKISQVKRDFNHITLIELKAIIVSNSVYNWLLYHDHASWFIVIMLSVL